MPCPFVPPAPLNSSLPTAPPWSSVPLFPPSPFFVPVYTSVTPSQQLFPCPSEPFAPPWPGKLSSSSTIGSTSVRHHPKTSSPLVSIAPPSSSFPLDLSPFNQALLHLIFCLPSPALRPLLLLALRLLLLLLPNPYLHTVISLVTARGRTLRGGALCHSFVLFRFFFFFWTCLPVVHVVFTVRISSSVSP